MYVFVQSSLIGYDQVGHIWGIGLWDGSVWQDVQSANSFDIDGEGVGMVEQGGIVHQCRYVREGHVYGK